jgi:hypothetical protein
MIKKIDKWIAIKLYPFVVRIWFRVFYKKYHDKNKLIQIIYHRNKDIYKKYGIGTKDIEFEVNKLYKAK